MTSTAKKAPLAIWKLITFLLMGLIIGYVVGRFELTTITFRTSSENENTKADQTAKTNDTGDTAKTQEPEKPVNVNIEGDNFLGNKDAKIVLVDFSDYQCPVSKYFTTTMLPKLKADYIDTGKMKYIYKDYPLNMHKFAVQASLTAECAGAQGKYWEMHDMIFNSQEVWSKVETPDETFKGYAKTLALNTAKFDECYASQATKDEIMEDKKTGTDLGVSGTPTLIVNGYITRGVPQDYENFKAYIDSKSGQ
jgi:protein-disulfide isomerase